MTKDIRSRQTGLRISGERLWSRLEAMGQIGATAKGGCNRQALTDLDKAGRDLFVAWCEAAGCSVQVDAMGNIFARREGSHPDLPPVIAGSHLDTQPTGGKYDGVYGVLSALEVVETLNDANVGTVHPIEIVVWTNEEGARFSPALIGSGVWSGVFDFQDCLDITDKANKRFGDELERIGYAGKVPARSKPLKAAFELHIEQGPILEATNKQIGVLSGIQGCRWYNLVIDGEPVHAGPTPMEVRKDPFMASLPIMQFCYDLAKLHGPWGRATFGDIKVRPGSRNTVPECVVVNVDLRHPDAAVLDDMDQAFRDKVEEECARFGLRSQVEEHWYMPVTRFDDGCVASVQKAVDQLGYSHMGMVSGAGHDSLYVASVAPTAMIFIPCENGISHNEAERISETDATAGCNVLLHAILDQAGTV